MSVTGRGVISCRFFVIDQAVVSNINSYIFRNRCKQRDDVERDKLVVILKIDVTNASTELSAILDGIGGITSQEKICGRCEYNHET